GRFGGIGDTHLARTIQTVAGLYATHPEETSDGDFGALCRKLLSEDEHKQLATAEGVGPISRRFQHLLAAQDEEIFNRVVRLVLRAKSEDIQVNYERLFRDLLNWRYRAERVQTDWARSFWAPATEVEE
ncbi:MAG: type I-E CRISPR-associated protein Cse2/CasB, partial [Acidobacteriales bacterium]|nr:type I-E CRISPR-associated protein Cse2/CasB [Terriglobales bacterium]